LHECASIWRWIHITCLAGFTNTSVCFENIRVTYIDRHSEHHHSMFPFGCVSYLLIEEDNWLLSLLALTLLSELLTIFLIGLEGTSSTICPPTPTSPPIVCVQQMLNYWAKYGEIQSIIVIVLKFVIFAGGCHCEYSPRTS
jgi:hypothetical protein